MKSSQVIVHIHAKQTHITYFVVGVIMLSFHFSHLKVVSSEIFHIGLHQIMYECYLFFFENACVVA